MCQSVLLTSSLVVIIMRSISEYEVIGKYDLSEGNLIK